MKTIRESVQQSGTLIAELNGLSTRVAETSTAISAIAKQTNLLSLNAGDRGGPGRRTRPRLRRSGG